MPSYVLMMDRDDTAMSWGLIPESLWQIIVKQFLNVQADGIALENVTKIDHIKQIKGLKTWKLILKTIINIHTQNVTRGNIKVEGNEQIAVFEYDTNIKELIEAIEFRQWSATSEYYSIDILYFFVQDKLIATIIPYESMIHFFISEEQKTMLDKLNPLLKRNLHHQENLTVEVTRIE